MSERQTPELNPSKEEVIQTINEYYKDAKVGSAKFMALYDFEEFLGIIIDSYGQNSEDEDWTKTIEIMIRKEVVGGRIAARTSEVPGYNAASKFIFNISEEIPDMNDNEVHRFLFDLSQSIIDEQK